MSTTRRRLVVGTRTSELALWQTHRVIRLLSRRSAELSLRIEQFITKGDADRSTPLHEMDTDDVFTQEIEDALRSGRIDFAVHSLKDLSPADPEDLCVAAVPERADVRDVLVSARDETLEALRVGARVGTCSLRRTGQLLAMRPDLEIVPIRGNVGDRVEQVKSGRFDATVLAAAGLSRIGLLHAASERFDLNRMLPAPAQGALGVQCRADDVSLRALLAAIDDPMLHRCVSAERQLLADMGGSYVPLAAYARADRNGPIRLDGKMVAIDGSSSRVASVAGEDPAALACELAALLQTAPDKTVREGVHAHAA